MKERDNNIFFDTASIRETVGIGGRAGAAYIENALKQRFPGETIHVISADINRTGRYKRLLCNISGLPPYCEVVVEHSIRRHTGQIIIWSPLRWNGRFAGAPGGGTATGGRGYITRPDNTSRGMTLPKAILNGFTAATTDAGNPEKFWALDSTTNRVDWERIENWHGRGTHFMTLIGKAVAEILHDRPVQFSYLHGGSGGGRQSMVEAQEYPEDYNGIWASCPAINWHRFLPVGAWPNAVMNSYRHILTPAKIKRFMLAAQDSVGGQEAYYGRTERVEFEPKSLIGTDGITDLDAKVMKEIWYGPRRANGERLWYGHRPGVRFWNVGIPVGTFYYTLLCHRPKPFFLSTFYLRWVTEDPKETFDKITMEEFEALYDQNLQTFEHYGADRPDLSAFAAAGGKLIIDHGTDDPLIPVDGTLDYYEKMCIAMGGKEQADRFCRLYITPGDGHGTCNWHGPGLTEREGMTSLMAWVERGEAPGRLQTLQTDKKGNTIREDEIFPQ